MEKMKCSYNKLIEWLSDYYKGKPNIKTYKGFEYSKEFARDVEDAKKEGVEFYIDPMLPIDLLRIQRKTQIDDETGKRKRVYYYKLFWLIFKKDSQLVKKLQFYRFYLSRITKLKGVDIIIVIPSKANTSLKNFLGDIAKDYGFGLWQINLSENEPIKLYESKDYREHMENTFLEPPENMEIFDNAIREQSDEIVLFFELFVREAIEAMIGILPKQVGKRYIERKVLDLVFSLSHVSFKKELQDLITQHLVQKGNDYDFVDRTFSRLWQKSKLGDYSNFLKISEPPLYNIFGRAKQDKPYRDHYLHQFQVFILGLYVIDKLRKKFPFQDIEKQWLIASSFHDMGYPIQLYDQWARDFFKKSLGVPDLGVTDMKSYFVEKTLLSCMGDIINSLCKSHFERDLKGNWLAEEEPLVKFFYEKITKVKHHCVISSLFLLKNPLIKNNSNLRNYIFVPAALSIALHHDKIWKELSEKHGLSLKFDVDPLSFLLLFCDAAQEWGRPKDRPLGESDITEGDESFLLEEFTVKDSKNSKCIITIRAPNLLVTDPIFTEKIRELEKLQRFLQPPSDVLFQITLKDKKDTKHEYPMIGTNK